MFDLTALSMQLARAEGDMGVFEGHRKRMVEIAMLLEEKTTIPAVKAQLGYMASMQESGFWKRFAIGPGRRTTHARAGALVPAQDRLRRSWR